MTFNVLLNGYSFVWTGSKQKTTSCTLLQQTQTLTIICRICICCFCIYQRLHWIGGSTYISSSHAEIACSAISMSSAAIKLICAKVWLLSCISQYRRLCGGNKRLNIYLCLCDSSFNSITTFIFIQYNGMYLHENTNWNMFLWVVVVFRIRQ